MLAISLGFDRTYILYRIVTHQGAARDDKRVPVYADTDNGVQQASVVAGMNVL